MEMEYDRMDVKLLWPEEEVSVMRRRSGRQQVEQQALPLSTDNCQQNFDWRRWRWGAESRLWGKGLLSHLCGHFLKREEKQDLGQGGYLKPKVWGAEAVSGWEEEEEEEEERSEMRSKGEPGSQQPTMEGRGPRQVNFFL